MCHRVIERIVESPDAQDTENPPRTGTPIVPALRRRVGTCSSGMADRFASGMLSGGGRSLSRTPRNSFVTTTLAEGSIRFSTVSRATP